MKKLFILLFALCLVASNLIASGSHAEALPATATTSAKLSLKEQMKAKALSKVSKMAQKNYEKRMERYERKMERYSAEGKGREPKKPQGPGLGIFFLGFLLIMVAGYINSTGGLGGTGLGWIPITFIVLGIICMLVAIVMAFG